MPRGVRNVAVPGESAEAKPEAVEQTEAEPKPEGLRAINVDPTKIRRGVLTLDGWVCPVTSPAPPARQ